MLSHVVFLCLVVLTMCHVHWFNQCYTSTNWRKKRLVGRPLHVGRHRKGSFTVKRGTQNLDPPNTQVVVSIPHTGSEYNLVKCHMCMSPCHTVVTCPLVLCTTCHEFGHMSYLCKKNIDASNKKTCGRTSEQPD
jgi:hypothetical protein